MGVTKSWREYYLKMYPGGRVQATDTSMDIFDKDGKHMVAIRKNGAGQWVCQSEEHGTEHRHRLDPDAHPCPTYDKETGKRTNADDDKKVASAVGPTGKVFGGQKTRDV